MKEVDSRISDYINVEKKYEERISEEQDKIDKEIKKLEEKKDNAEQALAKQQEKYEVLGNFNFGKKSELEEYMEQTSQTIDDLNNQITKKNEEIKSIKENIEYELRNEYGITRAQMDIIKYKQIILNILIKHSRSLSIDDLRNYSYELDMCSNQRIKALLNQLVEENKIILNKNNTYYIYDDRF